MAVSESQVMGGGLKKLLPKDTMLTSYSFLLHQHTVKCMLKATSKMIRQFIILLWHRIVKFLA